MINFALLSVRNHPLLNVFLNELKIRNTLPKAVIFDKKNLTEKEIDRYCDRTGKKKRNLIFLKILNIILKYLMLKIIIIMKL